MTADRRRPAARRFGDLFLPVRRSDQGLDDDRDDVESGIAQAHDLDLIARPI